jgi:hypothetical protein
MELTTDSVKILSSKLDARSLSMLMSISNSVNKLFGDALSDDYTYKLMTEELLETSLPEYRNHKWKDVYDFFVAKPEKLKTKKRTELNRWNSMSPIEQRLENALFSNDPVIVEVALLSGADPSVRLNAPAQKALREGNSKVARLLLSDKRVSDNLNNSIAMLAFKSGDIDTIDLILDNLKLSSKMMINPLLLLM